MENFDVAMQGFISKLEKTDSAFSNILKEDPSGLVIDGDDRRKLEDIAAHNKKILNKLKTKEFTVAVVGLEKAGKSTLGNAFLKNIVLPEYTERCTYTTTEIRAGSKDEGEIFFYSYDEFQNDFNKMLEQIKYDGKADFSTLDLGTFDRFWSSMETKDPATFQFYNGTTVEDIRAILQGRSVIKSLLGQGVKKFVGEDELQSREFQIYITGIGGFSGGKVDRSPHPYAVKKVNIRSANLGDMKHIVLYDVPGFDSPTKLHKKQTEDMLKEADAIILVTDVGGRPNLTGTQLDMLRNGYDADGIKLNEKAFVFGNKLDKADNEQRAKDNMSALKNDAIKYQVSSDNHIFFGSAKAYLESKNLRSPDEMARGNVDVSPKLKEWGLPDGIDELYGSMIDYYKTDRVNVLRKRAEKNIADAETFLRDILEKNKVSDTINRKGFEIAVRAVRCLETYREAVYDVVDEAKNRINKEKPFSNLIIDDINSGRIYKDVLPDSDIVANAIKQTALGTGDVFQDGDVDINIRKKLRVELTRELLERANEETQREEAEIYDAWADKLLEILEVYESSRYYAELKTELLNIFDEIMVDNNGERCRFNTLIKRFSGNLIEAVILHPFANRARLSKVKDESLPEFFSLAAYYTAKDGGFGQDIDLENDNMRLKIFSQILAHGEVGETDVSETQNGLFAFLENNKTFITFAIDALPINGWARRIVKAGLQFDASNAKDPIKRAIENAFFYKDWDKLNKDDREALIGGAIEKACQANEAAVPPKESLVETLVALHQEAVTKKETEKKKIDEVSKTLEEKNDALKKMVIDTLNEDMKNLRDITVNAVVKATNLEQAFNSVIIDNIEFIRREAMKHGKLDNWLINNLDKIEEEEIAVLNRNEMEAKTRKNIVENIEKVLNDMNSVGGI